MVAAFVKTVLALGAAADPVSSIPKRLNRAVDTSLSDYRDSHNIARKTGMLVHTTTPEYDPASDATVVVWTPFSDYTQPLTDHLNLLLDAVKRTQAITAR